MAGGKAHELAIYKRDWGFERSSLRGVPVAGNLFCRTRDYWKQIQSMVRVELELGTSGLQVQRSNRSATLPSNKNSTRLGWDSRQTLNDTLEGFLYAHFLPLVFLEPR